MAKPKFRNTWDIYLKDAQDYAPLALGGALTNNLLYIDRMNKAFKEALGDLQIIKGANFSFGTFELVTQGAYPLSRLGPGVEKMP